MSDYCKKCGVCIVDGLTMCACDEEEYCPDCGNIIDECGCEYEEEDDDDWDYTADEPRCEFCSEVICRG